MDSKPKTITNPRRLLILTPTTTSTTATATATIDPVNTIPPLLSALTGESINDDNLPQVPVESAEATGKTKTSFAGYTTHAPLHIETRYYTADVPIWVDEINTSETESAEKEEEEEKGEGQWKTEFLSDEAQVVRDAIGALLVCARNPVMPSKAIPAEAFDDENGSRNTKHAQVIKNTVRIVNEVKQKTEEERDGGMGEVPGLLVLLNDSSSGNTTGREKKEDDEDYQPEQVDPFSAAWWEDTLYEMGIIGFEVVLWDPAETSGTAMTRNEFCELQGLPRIKEVLSALEWGSPSADDESDDDANEFLAGMDDGGLGLEVGQLEREMMGLRFAINNNGNDNDDDNDTNNDGGDSELQVDDLEALMMRMRAIKDMSADLPEAQRKAFAAKAVRDIMREL